MGGMGVGMRAAMTPQRPQGATRSRGVMGGMGMGASSMSGFAPLGGYGGYGF
jgi:hypothetical protein